MVRMETACDMIFEKVSRCPLFKGSSLAQKLMKFFKNVAAVWKLLLII